MSDLPWLVCGAVSLTSCVVCCRQLPPTVSAPMTNRLHRTGMQIGTTGLIDVITLLSSVKALYDVCFNNFTDRDINLLLYT